MLAVKAQSKKKPYLVRLAIVFGISLVFVVAFNEITYAMQREPYDRQPEIVQVIIPHGTAERMKAGEPEPTIPEDLVFVVGDVLEVVNQDEVSHQLGPMWVPAGATGTLGMDEPTTMSYSCSFQVDESIDIDVRQATTWGTRLIGITLAVPTMAALIYLYSLAAVPIREPKGTKKNDGSTTDTAEEG